MTDLAKLREALKQLELRGASTATQAAKDGIGTDLVRVLDAARAYADLLENGPTDEMVERATDAFFEVSLNGGLVRRGDGALMPDWENAIRAALSAALGGEE